MANNFCDVPGVKYIVGFNFKSELGEHLTGDVLTAEVANSFPNLEILVSNHFLWPYAPKSNYGWLPPHLFNDVLLREEAEAQLAADATPTGDWEPPGQLKQAEEAAEQQNVIYEKIMNPVQPGMKEKPEVAQAAAAEPAPVKKAVAKRTAKKATERTNNG